MRRWTRSDLDGDSVDLEEWTCVPSPELRLIVSDSEGLLELLLEVDDVDGNRLAPSLSEDVLHGLEE